MAAEEFWTEAEASQMLLEATESASSHKTEVVKNLLKTNRELFSNDVLNQSLLSCCRIGLLHLMPAIISAGANLEATDENGNTPLLVCALYRHESCARCLIGAGANVNAVNVDGNTPLIVSVRTCGSQEMIKLLISSKHVMIDFKNNIGCSALFYAIETANLNAMKLLIDADRTSDTNNGSHSLKDVASKKELLRLYNLFQLQKATGKSSLFHAVVDRDIESAQILISMEDSIINTCMVIDFLKYIQDNNNSVSESDVEMLVFLLNHVIDTPKMSRENDIIVDVAISIGNHEIVESLSQFDFVFSCEHLISSICKPDFLRLLLTKRHIINKLDLDNQPVYIGSPLHQAMQTLEIESAKALTQHGAFMNIDQALEDTVKWNQEMALQFIISDFLGQVGPKLRSPKVLHDAVINSALRIIPILLDHGADINAEYNGKYCLTEVVDVNVLELLLTRGADPNIRIGSNPYTYPIHTFLSKEFKREQKNKRTSLQPSLVTNSFLNKEIKAFVQCLLKHGAHADQKDGQGQTALHIAAAKGPTVGLFKILVSSGADVNLVDNQGQSPIHKSVNSKNIGKLNCLVRNNATIDLKDHRGQTALHIAAASKSNSSEILNILIDTGADVNTTDNWGETPLSNAVVFGNNENLKILIDAGANINFVRRITGKPVLFDATNASILETLLDHGASVKTMNRESPLNSLMARCSISLESVKRLIDAGCDVNHVNKDGDSVLIIATGCIDIKLLEVLVEKGAYVNASGRRDETQTAVIGLLSQIFESQKKYFRVSNI